MALACQVHNLEGRNSGARLVEDGFRLESGDGGEILSV